MFYNSFEGNVSTRYDLHGDGYSVNIGSQPDSCFLASSNEMSSGIGKLRINYNSSFLVQQRIQLCHRVP